MAWPERSAQQERVTVDCPRVTGQSLGCSPLERLGSGRAERGLRVDDSGAERRGRQKQKARGRKGHGEADRGGGKKRSVRQSMVKEEAGGSGAAVGDWAAHPGP